MRAACLASFAVLISVGCGGQVEGSGEPPAPAAATSATNAPSSAPSADGCTRACTRMLSTCTGAGDPEPCVRSCDRDFAGDVDAARRYAACIEALPCSEIERGLTMDYGPLGECYAQARRDR